MSRPALLNCRLLLLPTGLAASLAIGPAGFRGAGYAPVAALSVDTLRAKSADRAGPSRRGTLAVGADIPGYLSPRGLPPVPGRFTVSDSGLAFQAGDGSATTEWRPATVSLAYIDEYDGRPVYVFRVDAGVFETQSPGTLLDVASQPGGVDVPTSGATASETMLVDGSDSAAVRILAGDIAGSAYADSLYLLFGRPAAPVGLVGHRGRNAGRLGEYIAARDSLALDLGRMRDAGQLRHAMAHELAHRWQSRAPFQLTTLWTGVAPIRDPKRYGFNDRSEHQAEAIAFAVNFLQTTAQSSRSSAAAVTLLDHYELMVPGTRTMVRFLSLQPLYRDHPLRGLLTTGR